MNTGKVRPLTIYRLFPATKRDWIAYSAILIGFFVTARIFQGIYFGINTSPAIIWPPIGIAFAGMLMYGYRMWSAIALGALAAYAFSRSTNVGLISSVVIANTVLPIFGTYLFRRLGFSLSISRLQDALILLFGGLLVAAVFPIVNLGIRLLVGAITFQSFIGGWGRLIAGMFLSITLVTPLIITWYHNWRIQWNGWYTVQALIAFFSLVAIDYLIFWTPSSSVGGVSLVYLMLIPFFWIGIRFTPRLMTLSLFLTAAIAISGTLFVTPIPPNGIQLPPIGQRLFLLEIFLEVIAAMFILLVAVVEERRQATRDLKDQIDQLEKALLQIQEQDKAKSESLAILAHELRNPLSPVLSTLELLQMNHLAERDESEMLKAAEGRIRGMAVLLDDLLDISRISQKRFKLEKEKIELRQIITRAVESVQSIVVARHHTLSVQMPEEEIWLDADPARFEQILVNLLTNAAKYTEPGGTIVLTCVRDESGLHIAVRDTGIGIAPHMLQSIFEPFLQIPQKNVRGSGLGLGLSLTKRLAEMHDGTIEAGSAGLGHGSVFTAHFPPSIIVEVKEPILTQSFSGMETEKPVRPLPEHAFKILVVDDNEAAAQGIGKLLELRGHQVTLAYDGKSALEAAAIFDPNIIVLDIGLPDMDGYQVAESLRTRDGNSIVLVALTGYGQAEDKRRAEAAGFNYHLTKPIGLAEIEAVIVQIPK